ncbi:MAG: hypothetical protein HFJ32_03060 [Clostridia bacterium]|nr:hypothetical protein [Clostridia bacterium]
MKGKHAKSLAVPKRMQTRDLDEEQQYSQILSKADELFREKILQDVEIQELIRKAQQYEEVQPISRKSFFGKLIEKAKQVTKKQVTAFSTLMIMLMQMFSPYTVLLSTVKAAVDPKTDTLLAVTASEVKTSSSGNRIIEVTYAITGENIVSTDLSIGYDSTKIKPARRGTGAACTVTKLAANNPSTSCAEFGDALSFLDLDNGALNTTNSNIRISMSCPAGGDPVLNVGDQGYSQDDLGEEAYGYNYYLPAVKLYFLLVDDSITELTHDMLYFSKVSDTWPTGYKYIYNNGSGDRTCIDPTTTVSYNGFAEAKKAVTNIEVTQNPTDVTYKNGDTLDFAGGTITIHYDDGSKDENVSIADGIQDGSITVDTQYASNTTKKAVITYSGKTAEIPYYVLSGAMLRTIITKTTYDHGDNLDFTGGEIDTIYTNSSGAQIREEISIPKGLGNQTIETNTTTADVNKNPVKLTYEGYTIDLPITVNDPLDHITVNPPTKITYEHGDNISFAGGSITTYTKSGATAIIPATDAGITIEPTTADINTVINSWTTPSGLTAGTEEITVKYQGKSAKYNITVNDTIDSINVTKQPTAKNKYGETNPDFTGLEVTVTTAGGGSFTVNQNSVSIDKSGYNPNTLTEQQFTVTYGGKTSTTKAKLTLQDYITDIIPTFTTTTFEYDTPVATIINGATYVKKYKSGATGTAEPITAGMISGYTQRPAPTLFNSSHEASQTINIKLTNGTNSFDEVPITKTQAITIKDKITGIAIENYPSTMGFDYGDAFVATNGKIKTVYASGAKGDSIYMSDPNVKLTQTDGTTPVTTQVAKSKFSNGQATETVKVTYTKDGKSYTTTYDITISDKVTGIAITTDPTKTFEHGAAFTTGNGKLTVSYAVADPQVISMSNADVTIKQTNGTAINMSPTTYDANHKYTEHLKVEYMGETATYDITITNVITGITLKPSPKTSYTYKEPITNAGGSIEITRKNGTTSTLPITDSMITGLNTDTVGTRQATVTYTENGVTKTAKYSYTVENSVTGVTITAPSKTTYKHGESLVAGKVTLTYADGTTSQGNWSDVTITDGGTAITALPTPTEAEYKASSTPHKISKTLKLNYTKDGVTATEVSYPIEIINDVKSIAMYQVPKQTYSVNDPIDVTGGEIMVTRAVGTEAIAITKEMTSGFDSSKEYLNNSLTITVTYTENNVTPAPTTSYKATVTDTVASIKITKLPKQDYKYNEPLDATAGKLEITRSSGQKVSVDMTNAMVSGYRPQDLEEQTLTVTYGGQTTTYTVTVKDYVTGITVSPTEVDGTYNQELVDLITNKNIMYTVNYAKAGALQPVAPTENMVTGYNKTDLNARNITITYTDNDSQSATNGDTFTATIKVTTPNVVTGATIVAPTDGTYQHGEPLKTGTVTLTYADGTTSQGNWSDVTITDGGTAITTLPTPTEAEYKASSTPHKISKTLKLNYTKDGVTATEVEYPIEIINDVKSIAMYQVPKQNYSVNDPIDVTGGEIMVTRAVGSEAIAITKEMTSGFDSSQEYPDNSLTITVTYTENGVTPAPTTSYTATVTDTVSSITMGNTPKTNYKYNEPLDTTGGTLTITRASGETKTVDITNAMITSTFDPQTLGEQTLTVTYGGKTTTYTVTVKDYVTGITVTPTEVDGTYNQELADLITNKNIMYTVNYAKAGALNPEAPTESMVTGYNKTDLGDRDITITYTDNDSQSATNGETFSATVTVKTPNGITGAVITAPTNTTYKDSESLAEGTITFTYANGDTTLGNWSDVTITNSDGTPYTMTATEDEYKANNHKISKVLKLNYNKDGVAATEVEYPIEIINDIKSIAISTVPKQDYNIGDTLDVTNGEILVTRAVGTENIAIVDTMVDGFDTTVEHKDLSLKVEYTENGITKETNYTIQVKDDVSSVTLKTTPKTDYLYGEPLDISGGELEITRPSGNVTIPVTMDMITSTFDPQNIAEQTVTIEYGGFTVEYQVNVKDYMTGIVLTPPAKTEYEYGEALDLTGGTVQKVMASGAETAKVDLSDTTQVTLGTYDPTKEGAQTITVEYAGKQASFAVTVVDNVQTIAMVDTPKQNYKYGEPLDINGGTILVTRSSGKTETINLDTNMVTGFNSNQLGQQTLTVTYKEATTNYTVEVEDYAIDIEITRPNKEIYALGEELDLTGATVKLVMASGIATTPVDMTTSMITGFDSSTEGAKTITVTYEGFTKTFGISIMDGVKGMILVTLPDMLEYRYGEELNLTGGTIALIKESGQTSPIPMTKDMVSGYSPNILGDQTITVTYEGCTQEFIVNVKDFISKLQVKAPTKTKYEYGEDLDLTGGTVGILMASGKVVEQTPLTASMISIFNNEQVGKQTIVVEYQGLQGEFQVIVEDKVKGISMNELPNKVEYEYREKLDVTGATINVVKSSGTIVVKVTNKMVSGFNPRKSGNQVITVTYEGMKTQFVVVVNAQEQTTPVRPVAPQEPVQEPEKPVDLVPEPTPTPIPAPEKPTIVLGEKDENNGFDKKTIAAIIGGLGILLLLILVVMRRRNIKIYVEEDGEFVLAGTEKLSRNDLTINIDQYLDGENYHNKVMICLNDSISDKLDEEEIEIKHRGEIVKVKVKYLGEPVDITLE